MNQGIFLFFVIFYRFDFAFSQPNECWVGDPQEVWLINLLNGKDKESEKDVVIQEWRKYRQRQQSTEGQFCPECEGKSLQKPVTELKKIPIPSENKISTSASSEEKNFFQKIVQFSKSFLPEEERKAPVVDHPAQERIPEVPSSINPVCIAASLQRESGSNKWKCKNKKGHPIEIQRTPCLRKEEVRYISWLTNSAIRCMNYLGQNLKPEIVFSLINNESGFRFFVGSSQGKGILQLTSNGKNEVLPSKKRKEFKESPLIAAIKKSSEPSCLAFQKSLNNFNAEESSMNTCQLLSPGEGFANSLILSLALYLTYRGSAAEQQIPKNLLPSNSQTLDKELSYSTTAYLEKHRQTKSLPLELRAELSQFLAIHAFSRNGPFSVNDMLGHLKFQAPQKKEGLKKYLDLFTQNLVEKSDYAQEVQFKLNEVSQYLTAATRVFEANEKIENQNLGPLRVSQERKRKKGPLIDPSLRQKCFANVPSPSP